MKNKSLLIITTLFVVVASSKMFAPGLKIVNPNKYNLYVKVDKMDAKKLAPVMDKQYKDWILIKAATEKAPTEQYVDTIVEKGQGKGERGVYYTKDHITFYSTPKFVSPDKMVIKDGENFEITETLKKAKALKATSTTKKEEIEKNKTETEAKIVKTDAKKIVEKVQQVSQLPKAVVDAAKKVIATIDQLEIIATGLNEESKRILTKAQTMKDKKLIHEKVALLSDLLSQNIRTFVSMGVYPLMDSLSKIIGETGKNIVSVFDDKTGKALMSTSDLIKSLKTNSGASIITEAGTTINKGKDQKSMNEYIDLVVKILNQTAASLKDTKWIRN